MISDEGLSVAPVAVGILSPKMRTTLGYCAGVTSAGQRTLRVCRVGVPLAVGAIGGRVGRVGWFW